MVALDADPRVTDFHNVEGAKFSPGHSLRNIATVLMDVAAPPSWLGPGSFSGFDVFCSYLLLDALVYINAVHQIIGFRPLLGFPDLETTGGFPLGWAPDMLLDDFTAIVEQGKYKLSVAHTNGPEAPWHLRILVRLTTARPHEFFHGPDWRPASTTGV